MLCLQSQLSCVCIKPDYSLSLTLTKCGTKPKHNHKIFNIAVVAKHAYCLNTGGKQIHFLIHTESMNAQSLSNNV